MLKKVLAVLAIVAMVAFAAPAMAGSYVDMGGNMYNSGTLFGTGDLYMLNQSYGDAGSSTGTGWTGVSVYSDLFGTISAYHGAGSIFNNSNFHAGASEGPGGTAVYSYTANHTSVSTIGNTIADLSGYIETLAMAGN